MRNFLPLLMKEEKAVFSSPIAYAIIAVYLLLMGYTFTLMLFLNRTAELVRIFFQAAVLFLSALYVLVNLSVDLLYGYLDPRIRVG